MALSMVLNHRHHRPGQPRVFQKCRTTFDITAVLRVLFRGKLLLTLNQVFGQRSLAYLGQQAAHRQVVKQTFIQAQLTTTNQRPNRCIQGVLVKKIIIVASAAEPQQSTGLTNDTGDHLAGKIGYRPQIRGLGGANSIKNLLKSRLAIVEKFPRSLYFFTQRYRNLVADRLADTQWRQFRSESTRLNSSHVRISYAVFCLKKKKKKKNKDRQQMTTTSRK